LTYRITTTDSKRGLIGFDSLIGTNLNLKNYENRTNNRSD